MINTIAVEESIILPKYLPWGLSGYIIISYLKQKNLFILGKSISG